MMESQENAARAEVPDCLETRALSVHLAIRGPLENPGKLAKSANRVSEALKVTKESPDPRENAVVGEFADRLATLVRTVLLALRGNLARTGSTDMDMDMDMEKRRRRPNQSTLFRISTRMSTMRIPMTMTANGTTVHIPVNGITTDRVTRWPSSASVSVANKFHHSGTRQTFWCKQQLISAIRANEICDRR